VTRWPLEMNWCRDGSGTGGKWSLIIIFKKVIKIEKKA
jgi:hypothetical protein